jgi:hypothetical protein
VVAAVLLATAVTLAIVLSGPSRIHTSFHRAPMAGHGLTRAIPPIVPHGFVRDGATHQLLPIQSTAHQPIH